MNFDKFHNLVLVHVRSALAVVVTSLAAHIGLHITEAHVRLTGVLILVGTRIHGGVVADILP